MSLLILTFFIVVSRAMYYLDDTDGSITYSNKNTTTAWSYSTLRSTSPLGSWQNNLVYAYNNTISVNFCETSDGCQMQIPFTGNGITLYVIQIADYGNFTVALDGGEPTVRALPYRSVASYNVSLYDVQSLSYGNHYVIVDMQDWTGGGSPIGSLIFDYAAVNGTDPAMGTSSASTSSATAANSSSAPQNSHNSIPVGAISGGVVGGLALVAAVVAALLYFRRKRTPESVLMEPFPALVMPSLTPGGAGNSRLRPPLQRNAKSLPLVMTSAEAADVTRGLLARRSSERLHPTKIVESSMSIAIPPIVSTTHSRTTSQPEALASAVNVSLTPVQTTFHPGSNFSDSQLTDEQVDFVQSLWNANVAAADIARVIERMKNGGPDEDGTGAVGGSSQGGLPPSYDSLRRQ